MPYHYGKGSHGGGMKKKKKKAKKAKRTGMRKSRR